MNNTGVTAPSSSKNRIIELDGLRGLAALSVLLYHYTTRFSEKFSLEQTVSVFGFKYGHAGVELFFILSGFVIFMTVEKIKSPADFAFKRFLRLYPTFWICLFLTFFLVNSFGPGIFHKTMTELMINLTMIPATFSTASIDGVCWTLRLELVFYLLIFFTMLFKAITKIEYLTCAYLLLLIGLFLYKHFEPTFYLSSLFAVGINYYIIWKGKSTYFNHLQILLSLILVLLSKNSERIISSTVCYSIFYLFAYKKAGFFKIGALVFIGEISYALYLLHQYIGYSIQLKLIGLGVNNFYLLLIIPFTISMLLAYVVTFYFERPLLKLITDYRKAKLFKSVSPLDDDALSVANAHSRSFSNSK